MIIQSCAALRRAVRSRRRHHRAALGAFLVLTGAGIGCYHLASLTGRLVASRVLGRWPERVTIPAAGLLAAGGLAVAPIVPSALSLAGGSVRSAQAVAATTAAGYSAFVISPILVGTIAGRMSLRACGKTSLTS